jgi:3'(2'), 5'-bisphosphate nucleotidase
VHDVAGGLALLAAAGGVALGDDGEEVRLHPDTDRTIRFVAAADRRTAEELLGAFR